MSVLHQDDGCLGEIAPKSDMPFGAMISSSEHMRVVSVVIAKSQDPRAAIKVARLDIILPSTREGISFHNDRLQLSGKPRFGTLHFSWQRYEKYAFFKATSNSELPFLL